MVHSSKKIAKHWMLTFILLSLFCGQQALATAELSDIDSLKTIMVDGADLPGAVGYPIKEFSLAAIVDDLMEPIPYQIDEYNEGGAVYFEGWDVPIAGSKDILDREDKLLFIYKDAGTRQNLDFEGSSPKRN